ncbi:MAG TPA: esterase [Parvularcula sp.]|nr:esterase [Parvularcula sp.]
MVGSRTAREVLVADKMTRVIAAVVALFCAACASTSQTSPAPPLLAAIDGDYFRWESAALGRALHIYVKLPEGYDPAATYPAVYLLDGDSTYPLLAPTHLFVAFDEPVPPAIIIGIAYGSFDRKMGNMRHVDFRPPAAVAPGSGAAAFQRFLADELIPEIERRYRSDPSRRILVGQSRGGAFVLYSALTAPDLFWGRIVSNASLTPGEEIFFGPPPAAARDDLKLFYASGERDRPEYRAPAQNGSLIGTRRRKNHGR